MSDKQLKDKAIKFKGRDYVLISDRVNFFNDNYENGCIVTHLISEPVSDMVVVKAIVTPNVDTPERYFTGYSQAKWGDGYINKTSALENAETSAVGRALAMMGIGVIESIASIDEINKAENTAKVDPVKQLEVKVKALETGNATLEACERGLTATKDYPELQKRIKAVMEKLNA